MNRVNQTTRPTTDAVAQLVTQLPCYPMIPGSKPGLATKKKFASERYPLNLFYNAFTPILFYLPRFLTSRRALGVYECGNRVGGYLYAAFVTRFKKNLKPRSKSSRYSATNAGLGSWLVFPDSPCVRDPGMGCCLGCVSVSCSTLLVQVSCEEKKSTSPQK